MKEEQLVDTEELPHEVHPPRLSRKFRQAAVVYLHVAILYEAGVYALWQAGDFPDARGSAPLWLAVGALIAGLVVWGLWSWQNRWFARVVWAIHALRVPALLQGAFLPPESLRLPTSFYLTALVVVLVNLAFLARAGWDL